MPRKKSCDKHYRYVASCPDCRALNEKASDERDRKRLYPDVDNVDEFDEDKEKERRESERSADIPVMSSGGGGPFDRSGRGDKKRFRYKPKKTKTPKKVKRIILGVVIIVLLVVGLYAIPVWHANISLMNQLYFNKSGELLYWEEIYRLNGWSSNFFFNKTALIGACIGSFLMSIPPEKNLMMMIKQKTGRGKLTTKYILVFWWTAGFLLFYLIGQGLDNGYFSLTIYMFDEGTLSLDDLTNRNIFNAFKMLTNPSAVSMVDLYVFQTLVHPLINFILGIIIVRLIINLVTYFYFNPNLLKMFAFISFIISNAFILGLFNLVGKPKDALSLIRLNSVWIGIFAFFILGVFILYYEKNKESGENFVFTQTTRKKAIAAIAVIIFIILIPVFIAIPKQIALNQYDQWEELKWDARYDNEVEWTRATSGIDMGTGYKQNFLTRDVGNYTESVVTPDSSITQNTRQYDKLISGKQLVKEIKTTHESMGDSDIVYVKGKGEYWVAPKTLDMGFLSGDSVNLHTEKFDHVSGFMALDTSTGDVVSPSEYQEIFGISMENAKIFFGEREDKSYEVSSSNVEYFNNLNAYENDILLNTDWGNKTYTGEEDGTLSGLEAFWYVLDMGLTTYAFNSSEKKVLTNRNIRTRVSSALLPGLEVDNDPYIVFNQEEGEMFYCLSLYTRLPMDGFAQSPIYRFMGVVLIDVQTGELNWYKNPNLPVPAEDPLSNLWKIFDIQYPWQSVPDWLKVQLRFPEGLWESQLSADYRYHVQDPITWNNGNDFYERPDNGDVYYIETDLGDGLEFCAVDLVEYVGEGATKLAGIYIMRHGEHFGETVFYKVGRDTTLLGPETAKSQLSTEATEAISLIQDPRYGNKLLYPLADSLYYYIPIYSQSTDAYGDTYEELSLGGLINAFDKSVYFGEDVFEAYTNLALDRELDGDGEVDGEMTDISFNYTGSSEVEYSEDLDDWATSKIIVDYWNASSFNNVRNFTLNLTIQTSNLPNDEVLKFNVSVFGDLKEGYQFTYGETGFPAFNYTISEDFSLNPGQGTIFTVKYKPEEFVGGNSISYLYKYDLLDVDNGDVKLGSTGWNTISFTQ